jgi:hypothetical protein
MNALLADTTARGSGTPRCPPTEMTMYALLADTTARGGDPALSTHRDDNVRSPGGHNRARPAVPGLVLRMHPKPLRRQLSQFCLSVLDGLGVPVCRRDGAGQQKLAFGVDRPLLRPGGRTGFPIQALLQ